MNLGASNGGGCGVGGGSERGWLERVVTGREMIGRGAMRISVEWDLNGAGRRAILDRGWQ